MATQWTAQGITSGAVLPASTLQSIGAVWESYTPTVKAGATTLTGTVNTARYCQIQKTVILQVLFTASNTGAANGIISVSYPVSLTPATATNRPIGSFFIQDTGTAFYVGIATAQNPCQGLGYGSNNNMGANTPALTIVSGDIIGVELTYEVA
jgi:hypothetical protein